MTAYRFFSIKNVQATTPIQWHRWNNAVNWSDVRILLSLRMFKLSAARSKLQRKFSVAYFDKSFTTLPIGLYGKLPQITWSVFSSSAIVFGFV